MKDQKQWVSEVFDRTASEYGKNSSAFFSHFGQRLVQYANVTQGARALDVATGKGAVLFPLAEIIGAQGSVIGIDISPQKIPYKYFNYYSSLEPRSIAQSPRK